MPYAERMKTKGKMLSIALLEGYDAAQRKLKDTTSRRTRSLESRKFSQDDMTLKLSRSFFEELKIERL